MQHASDEGCSPARGRSTVRTSSSTKLLPCCLHFSTRRLSSSSWSYFANWLRSCRRILATNSEGSSVLSSALAEQMWCATTLILASLRFASCTASADLPTPGSPVISSSFFLEFFSTSHL